MTITDQETWTIKPAAEMTELPARRVLFYTEQGLLPGLKKSVGRGTARSYKKIHIFYLSLIRELSELGLSLTRIRGVILYLDVLPVSGGSFPSVKLWENGEFTKEPVILIISTDPETHALAPTAAGYNEEFSMQVVHGTEEIKLKSDTRSKIVINLNKIWNRIKF